MFTFLNVGKKPKEEEKACTVVRITDQCMQYEL